MGAVITFVLFLIQLVSIGSCTFGIYKLSVVRTFSVFSIVLCGIFYTLGLACNICGLVSSWYSFMDSRGGSGDESDDEVEDGKFSAEESSQYYIQYHYLLAWLAVVIGYPSIVIHSWLVHYNNTMAQVHFLLIILPLVCWFRKNATEIAFATQISGCLAVASHAYIEYLAGDKVGIAGAATMLFCLITIAVPTKYRLFGLSAREFYLLLLASSAFIFAYNIPISSVPPVRVKSLTLTPWLKSK